MSSNRAPVYNRNQLQTKTFRASDNRKMNPNRVPTRGNNATNRQQAMSDSNERTGSNQSGGYQQSGSNQGHSRYNKPVTNTQNSSANSAQEKDVIRDNAAPVRSKQINAQKWTSYCQLWQDYIVKGQQNCIRFLYSPLNGKNIYNGSPNIGAKPPRYLEVASYSSVVGSNSQHLTTNPIFTPNLATLPYPQVTPSISMNTANVSSELNNTLNQPFGAAQNSSTEPQESVASDAKSLVAAESSQNSANTPTQAQSSNYTNRYHGEGGGFYGNRGRRGNRYNHSGNRSNYNSKGYSQNRNNARFGGDVMNPQSYPFVPISLQPVPVPYEYHIPYADCQACCNNFYTSLQFGYPVHYSPVAPFAIAQHNNAFSSEPLAAASLPPTPASTPSDASVTSESLRNPLGNVKFVQSSEKVPPVKDNSGGTDAPQTMGISGDISNSAVIPRSFATSVLPQSGDQLPDGFVQQPAVTGLWIPSEVPQMQVPQGYLISDQSLLANYGNEAGCIFTPSPLVYFPAPNYGANMEPSFQTEI